MTTVEVNAIAMAMFLIVLGVINVIAPLMFYRYTLEAIKAKEADNADMREYVRQACHQFRAIASDYQHNCVELHKGVYQQIQQDLKELTNEFSEHSKALTTQYREVEALQQLVAQSIAAQQESTAAQQEGTAEIKSCGTMIDSLIMRLDDASSAEKDQLQDYNPLSGAGKILTNLFSKPTT